MSVSHLIILIARLFAVMIAITASNHFVYALVAGITSFDFPLLPLVYFWSLMLLGLLIWFLPLSFVRLLTGYRSEVQENRPSVSTEQFSQVVFTALAIYLLFRVISDVSYWLVFFQSARSPVAYESVEIGTENMASMVATAVEAVFVVVLLLGRKRIFHFVRQLQS